MCKTNLIIFISLWTATPVSCATKRTRLAVVKAQQAEPWCWGPLSRDRQYSLATDPGAWISQTTMTHSCSRLTSIGVRTHPPVVTPCTLTAGRSTLMTWSRRRGGNPIGKCWNSLYAVVKVVFVILWLFGLVLLSRKGGGYLIDEFWNDVCWGAEIVLVIFVTLLVFNIGTSVISWEEGCWYLVFLRKFERSQLVILFLSFYDGKHYNFGKR